ncbi:MAG: VRR-NUC domain-containing protein [Pseudomonadales bacterium]
MVPSLVRQAPPPPDYYARNLRFLLDAVAAQSGDLLTADERGFLQAFQGASTSAQRLFARLLTRSGRWLRIDSLNYAEVGDRDRALAELRGAGLAVLTPDAPADALLRLLTRPELAALFPRVRARTKPQWIAECVGRYGDRQIRARVAARHPWVEVGYGHAFAVCQVLFFGGDRQDLSTFVLQDLGIRRYERYPLSPDTRPFEQRGELDRYLSCRRLAPWVERLEQMPQLATALCCALVPPAQSRIEQRTRDRILNQVGRWHERRGEWQQALQSYQHATSHPARERRARILRRLGDEAAVAALLTEIRADPWAPEEQDFARRFAGVRPAPGARVSELRLAAATPGAIERHAIDVLTANGGCGWHLENQLPLGLAGLAFWPQIFAAVKGAFSHPFQLGPRDLFWPDFARTRAAVLAARIRALEAPGAFEHQVREVYAAKYGTANRLVHWGAITPEVLDGLLGNVCHRALLRLAAYTVANLGRARAGFPDLLLVYGRAAWELVEVKGPTDQLQPAQRVWLAALHELQIPVRVLRFRAAC